MLLNGNDNDSGNSKPIMISEPHANSLKKVSTYWHLNEYLLSWRQNFIEMQFPERNILNFNWLLFNLFPKD